MKVIATNKKGYHDYLITETLEAGIVLIGDEVKSIRNKNVSLNDSFATVNKGRLVLINCYIASYKDAYTKNESLTKRSRVLLLKKREMSKLIGDISKKGVTVIPLKMYFNNRGYVKIELGVAKHKKSIDKKRILREKDIKRELQREMKIKL